MMLAVGDANEAAKQWLYLLGDLSGDPWLQQHEVDVRKRLASAYEAAGLRAPALAQYLDVLAQNPGDPEARAAIARLARRD